jgi:hypothetical protein
MACRFLPADHAAITAMASVGFVELDLCHADEADKNESSPLGRFTFIVLSRQDIAC